MWSMLSHFMLRGVVSCIFVLAFYFSCFACVFCVFFVLTSSNAINGSYCVCQFDCPCIASFFVVASITAMTASSNYQQTAFSENKIFTIVRILYNNASYHITLTHPYNIYSTLYQHHKHHIFNLVNSSKNYDRLR